MNYFVILGYFNIYLILILGYTYICSHNGCLWRRLDVVFLVGSKSMFSSAYLQCL